MAWLQNLVAPVFCSDRMSSLRQRDTYAFNERICLTFLFPRPTLGSDTCTVRKEQLPKRRGRLCFSSRFRSSCPSSYLPIFPWQWKFIELAGYLKKYPTCSLPLCLRSAGTLKRAIGKPCMKRLLPANIFHVSDFSLFIAFSYKLPEVLDSSEIPGWHF